MRHAVLFLLLTFSGCTAVTLASVGTAAGIAASAVSTGTDVYQMGKLDSAEMASIERVEAASNRAMSELGLTLMDSNADEVRRVTFHFEDAKRSAVEIRLDPRTPNLTRIRIDVGWFGDEPTARLILSRVRSHLGPLPTTEQAAE